MMQIRQKLIYKFQKNSAEVIKVYLQTWKAQPYFDVRIRGLDNPREEAEERPTHKGLTLHKELLPELIAVLQKVQAALNGKGGNDQTKSNLFKMP